MNHRLKTNISLGHRGLLGDLDIYTDGQKKRYGKIESFIACGS